MACVVCACGGRLTDGADAATTDDGSAVDATSDAGHDGSDGGVTDAMSFDGAFLGFASFSSDDVAGGAGFDAVFYSTIDKANAYCPIILDAGHCKLSVCPQAFTPGADVTAGTLTITGASLPTSGTAVDPDWQSFYSQSIDTLDTGDVMGVSAMGAQVPAFGAHTVVVPAPVALTSPTPPYVVSTSHDLNVTWSGGEVGAVVHVTVQTDAVTTDAGSVYYEVDCGFDATTASGVVPGTLLSELVGSGGVLFWTQERDVAFAAGAFPIELSAVRIAYAQAAFQPN